MSGIRGHHVWVIPVLAEIKMYYVCMLRALFVVRRFQGAPSCIHVWVIHVLAEIKMCINTVCIVCCQTHWWWPWTYIWTGRSVCEVHAWHSRVLASAGRQGMESFCKQRCLQLVNMYSFQLGSALRHTLIQTGSCRRLLGISCWVVPFSANNLLLWQELWPVCVFWNVLMSAVWSVCFIVVAFFKLRAVTQVYNQRYENITLTTTKKAREHI